MTINLYIIVMSLELIVSEKSVKFFIENFLNVILDFWLINYNSIILTGIFVALLFIIYRSSKPNNLKNQTSIEVAVAFDETRVKNTDERKKSARVEAAENADKLQAEINLKKKLCKKLLISVAESRENARRKHNIEFGTDY